MSIDPNVGFGRDCINPTWRMKFTDQESGETVRLRYEFDIVQYGPHVEASVRTQVGFISCKTALPAVPEKFDVISGWEFALPIGLPLAALGKSLPFTLRIGKTTIRPVFPKPLSVEENLGSDHQHSEAEPALPPKPINMAVWRMDVYPNGLSVGLLRVMSGSGSINADDARQLQKKDATYHYKQSVRLIVARLCWIVTGGYLTLALAWNFAAPQITKMIRRDQHKLTAKHSHRIQRLQSQRSGNSETA